VKRLCGILVMATLFLMAGVLAQPDDRSGAAEQTLTLMTYNLKFASPTFEPPWEIRREMQVDLIRQYSPDIIGTQEGLKEQVDYLADVLTDYVVVGEGRKGGDDDEHMAIFFKRDRFRLREMGSFQLSNTPEVIGSGPEVNPRMVTWVRLAFITRRGESEASPYRGDYRGHWENTREFYVFNTHFFHKKSQFLAKWNSAQLILDRVHALDRFGTWETERPVFLVGDFNSQPEGEIYEALVGDGDPQRFRDSVEGGQGIDWILYRGDLEVLHHERIDYNVNGAYPSDHLPVLARFRFPEND
jgi:endonuclease/exonuclease/phosphatase family metal-dependent hydrolase